jgi:hypothetical protein
MAGGGAVAQGGRDIGSRSSENDHLQPGLDQDPRALPSLQAALNDNHQDVRWNAPALAEFATLRVSKSHQMLDRITECLSRDQRASPTYDQRGTSRGSAQRFSSRTLLEELKANDPTSKSAQRSHWALKEIDAGVQILKKVGSP